MAGREHRINIKLRQSELRAAIKAHTFVMDNYEVETEHELLLLHHHIAMRLRLRKMADNLQKTYGLTLTATEALAFWQLWMRIDLQALPTYEALIMQNIINHIDKHRKVITQTPTYEQDIH